MVEEALNVLLLNDFNLALLPGCDACNCRKNIYFLTLAVQNDSFWLVAIYQVVIGCGKVFRVNRSTFSYLCKYVCTQKEEPFRQHQRGGDRQEFGQT